MKHLRRMYILVIAMFIIVIVSTNLILRKNMERDQGERNIVVNRIVSAIQTDFYVDETADINELARKNYFNKLPEYKKAYKLVALPDNIVFIDNNISEEIVSYEGNQKLGVLKDSEGNIIGFLLFVFDDKLTNQNIIFINAGFVLLLLILILFIIFFDNKILKPFNEFSEYPERLSKGLVIEKLPENKEKYFGKFIWGVNMLNDKIANDNKRINKLMQEKQTMLTTLAHGIKTPVANVKLYASAIDTGLYQKDGFPNEEDAVIAKKIDKNADNITAIVKEMLENTSKGMVAFEAKPRMFYVKELTDYIKEEYDNRLRTLHIPYSINLETEAMIDSDKEGLIRILSQLMENAIKYGDGGGISINIEKNEEGFFFSVKNKGTPVTENELPYLFNSFWRGANAKLVEGSGIGLFEAKSIALKLGGDIFAKRLTDTDEMEFVVYIEA